MLLPVKIDPIDRGLPTDVDKARIAAKLREPGCADDAAAFYDAVAISLHSALDFEDADVGAQEMLEMLADLIDPVGPVVECRLCGERAAKADEAGDSGKGGPERGHRGQGDQAPSRVWLDRGRGAMARVRLAGREFLQDARMRPRASRTWYNPLNTAADAGIDARGDHVRRRDARGRRSAKPVFFGWLRSETPGHRPKLAALASVSVETTWLSDRETEVFAPYLVSVSVETTWLSDKRSRHPIVFTLVLELSEMIRLSGKAGGGMRAPQVFRLRAARIPDDFEIFPLSVCNVAFPDYRIIAEDLQI